MTAPSFSIGDRVRIRPEAAKQFPERLASLPEMTISDLTPLGPESRPVSVKTPDGRALLIPRDWLEKV